MHVLYVHQNFPAQFGHLAGYLAREFGFRCTFLSQHAGATVAGVERIQYALKGAASSATHPLSRSFENFTWHTHAVYEALKARPDVRPDIVVGHSGFGSTLFIPELYRCPVINLCEWFYLPDGSDSDFFRSQRAESGMRARSRNAMLLADLLRGYPATFSGGKLVLERCIASGRLKSSQEQVDAADADHGFARIGANFIVLAQAA